MQILGRAAVSPWRLNQQVEAIAGCSRDDEDRPGPFRTSADAGSLKRNGPQILSERFYDERLTAFFPFTIPAVRLPPGGLFVY